MNQLTAASSQTQTSEEMQTRGGEPSTAAVKAAAAAQPAASEPAVQEGAPRVYLTFDDGPGTQTEKILDILKEQDVKATFFVTGKEDEYSKKIYKRIVDEGHTLGMHSYSHRYDEIYSSVESFSADVDRLYNLLYETTGQYPLYYRFPGGSNTLTMKVPLHELVSVLEQKNLTYIDWNVLSPEGKNPSISGKKMTKDILSDIAEYDVSVVLLYDSADKPLTVKTLPTVIKTLKKKDCQLLPIDSGTVMIRHNQ